jgi:hypothetical protein
MREGLPYCPVQERRQREKQWHKWRRMQEQDLELCTLHRLGGRGLHSSSFQLKLSRF